MTKRRMARIMVLAAAGTATVVGLLGAGWGGYPAPVPVLTAVTVPTGVVARTPCTVTAQACVDLTTKHAWLIRDGRILVGPVPINIGGPGELTPVGTFKVWRKDPHHVSVQQHGTPMPYSVFFDRGVAFHSGPLELMSAGCVHLRLTDAMTFYRTLRLGDQVQVRAAPLRHQPVATRPIGPHTRALPVPARPRTASGAVNNQPSATPRVATPAARPAAHPVAAPGLHVLPPAAVTPRATRPAVTARPGVPQ